MFCTLTATNYLVVVVVVVVVVSAIFAVVSATTGAVALRAVVSTAGVVVASSLGLLLQAVRTTIEVTTNAKNTFFISLIFV